jgi:hypothetical protein
LSRESCAELLDRSTAEVDAYTCCAIESLSHAALSSLAA